ncbi:unnamed protein product [Bursaphelenchus xylophilus]|uniref:(pine wood nematode) hypothetical protein n=1 Tax=Bursaphelenchus xylophilus TaxID=6326 RepID=A0A1I7SCZ7_BURXY|nr:unnamed protein product [Bursaphelenchus xylophilus]CAG9093189.1 unnamed protein product [Bursaphelenchus xylophilus]
MDSPETPPSSRPRQVNVSNDSQISENSSGSRSSSQRRRSLRAPSKIRPTKYIRQDPGNFRIHPNLHSIVREAHAMLNQLDPESVSAFAVNVNKEHINYAFLNKLKDLQDKGEVTLQKQTVVVYSDGSEGEERYEVLDGNHRILALQEWFLRKYGPDNLDKLNHHIISAIIVRQVCSPETRCLIGWKAHVGTSCHVQARRNVKKNAGLDSLF